MIELQICLWAGNTENGPYTTQFIVPKNLKNILVIFPNAMISFPMQWYFDSLIFW